MITFLAIVGAILAVISYYRHKSWLTLTHGFYYLTLIIAPQIQLPVIITFLFVVVISLLSLYQLTTSIFTPTHLSKLEWALVIVNLVIVISLLFFF